VKSKTCRSSISGRIIVSFRHLDGFKARSNTAPVRRTPLNLALLLVFLACALVGGGFFDGHVGQL
jgi:hypothetical protein